MTTVRDAFNTLDYSPALESDAAARAWIAASGPAFDHVVAGQRRSPAAGERLETFEPATGAVLATLAQANGADVDAAVRAAREAFPAWRDRPGAARARHLYALARHVQQHQRVLAVLESIDNGKPVRETRDIDVPLVVRHLYHHAGWAQLADGELAGYEPHGVCAQIIPWNFPLLMLAWKVAPALAAGNTVVLKPAEHTSLSALRFAELAMAAGLPEGVLNIVTGDGRSGALLVEHPGVDKVAFTGSTTVGREIRQATAGSGKALTLELGGKSPFVVFDDADLDSAVEGLVDAIWFNQGQVCCAGSRLLVQESIAERLYARIRARMETLRVGHPLDKTVDLGAIVAPVQLERIQALCEQGKQEGATCWQPSWAVPQEGWFFPPTLFTDVAPASTIAVEEIFGPVLVAMSFRTPAEAVALANDTRYGLAASVWTQDLDKALEVATRVAAGTVWVNGTNHFDAASGFGGYRESGFGREGGREGMHAYLRPKRSSWALGVGATGEGATDPEAEGGKVRSSGGRADADGAGHVQSDGMLPAVDRTTKLYIGGRQVRPNGGHSLVMRREDGNVVGLVGRGNRKDIREAVAAARAADAWSRRAGHGRAQVLYYVAENLEARAAAVEARLATVTGCTAGQARHEVAVAVDALFTWAAWADKWDGAVHDTPQRALVTALHEPLGVVALVAPDGAPLAALMHLVGPLLATGNRVVALPSRPGAPMVAELYAVLETSDLPAGVLNLVTGVRGELAPVLADHDDVDGLWFAADGPGDPRLAAEIERRSAGNLKPTWVLPPAVRWLDRRPAPERERLRRATRVKNVWLPYGV